MSPRRFDNLAHLLAMSDLLFVGFDPDDDLQRREPDAFYDEVAGRGWSVFDANSPSTGSRPTLLSLR